MAIAAAVSSVISRSRAHSRDRDRVPAAAPGPTPTCAPTPTLVLICACAALPFLLAVIVLLARPNTFAVRGDSAVIELAVRNAADFAQHLGPYSRFGWTHPGPVWFYALVPIYLAGGGTAASLLASTQFLNAVMSVLIVLVASRRHTGPAIGAAAAVLLFALAAPSAVFAEIWNPYATVLPALLFLVLLVRARDGSPVWLLGALVAASFLVQTHVGTALPVAACLVAVVLFMLIGGVSRLRARPRATWFTWRRTRACQACAATALLCVVWIPPLQDQLSGTRNLTALIRFGDATHRAGTGHTASQGLVMIGRLVTPPLWTVDMTAVLTPGPVTAATVAGLCGFVLVNVAIGVLAWRRDARTAVSLSALAVLSVPVGVAAVVQIDGNLHNYLIAWFLAAPAATVLAACLLLSDVRLSGTSNPYLPSGRAGLAALVLGAVTATAFLLPRAGHSADCCTQNDVLGADRALAAAASSPPRPGAPIDIRYDDNREWPLATALAAALAEHGWSPRLPAGAAWTFKLPAVTGDPSVPRVWIRSGTEAPLPGYRVVARVPGVAMWQQGDFVGIVELRMRG